MTIIKTLAAAAAGAVLAKGAFAQSAREFRGASPYVGVENEPAPKLIVDPPLPEGLALGVFWASTAWRTFASLKCSDRAPSTYLHGSGICT
jgi:Family of unknown function (DUF6130)